uniref:helix-turn-helix domain-containing protein n=1 Tax=Bartonella sp. MM55XZML TaxID=3243552 RepID=UPI0035CFB25A
MTKKTRKGISLRAFAKKMGVSPNAVASRFKTGKFDAALFEDGSVNEALATAIWNENPTKRPPPFLAPDGQARTK